MIAVEVHTGEKFDFVVEVPPHVAVEINAAPAPVIIEVSKSGTPGPAGKTALELWLENNPGSTEADFWVAFKGDAGQGAYELAVELGYPGTKEEWLISLKADMTLEEARLLDARIFGDIDANGHTIANLRNASANQEPVTKAQQDALREEVVELINTATTNTTRWGGFWDFSTGQYPTGITGGIRRGDEFEANNLDPVTLPDGVEIEKGDIVRARIASPGQATANWSVLQGNSRQATEAIRGLSKVASSADAGNENSVNNADFITPSKLWTSFWSRVRVLPWTFNGKLTFGTPFCLSSIAPASILKLNATRDVEAAVANTDYLPVNSPAMLGNPTAPTQSNSDRSTRVATTAHVKAITDWYCFFDMAQSEKVKSDSVVDAPFQSRVVKTLVIPGGTLKAGSLLEVMITLEKNLPNFSSVARLMLGNTAIGQVNMNANFYTIDFLKRYKMGDGVLKYQHHAVNDLSPGSTLPSTEIAFNPAVDNTLTLTIVVPTAAGQEVWATLLTGKVSG